MAASARRLDTASFPLFGPKTAAKPAELPETPQPVERPRLVPPPPPVLPGEREDVRQLRASLAGTAAARLVNGSELIRALETKRRDELLPTTLAPLDALLGGGLPRGKVVELTGRRMAGRFSIVLSALAASTSLGEAAALIDLGDHFDPQIGEATGIDLRRMLWIRPRTLKQAVMSAEMIAAAGFQTVILDAGSHPIRHGEKGRRVPDAAWVRLARSAEAHGTVMMIATPYALTGTASEALVAARRARPKWIGGGKSPRVLAGIEVPVTLEKHRHMKPGRHAALFFATLEAVLAGVLAGGWQLTADGKDATPAPPAASRQPSAPPSCFA